MLLTAKDRLVLIRVKIERAKKHLGNLESELVTFRNERLNVVIAKNHPQTGQQTRVHVDLPILPFNAIAAAGDIVHNLRSALDHLAYQLVVVGSTGKEPSRFVEFPIAKDSATYESSKAKKVEGMRSEAVKAIDALKPYKGGNDVLWRIHELDNIDKHRTHFTVAHDYLFVADWMPSAGWPFLMKASDIHFAGIFDLKIQEDMQLEFEEAIGDPQIAKSNALLPSLHQMVDSVDNLVSSFQPLLELVPPGAIQTS